jgi:hypothetical protein
MGEYTKKNKKRPIFISTNPSKIENKNGGTGNAESALSETITPNPNKRTPYLNGSRQTRAGRERYNSGPICRLIVYFLNI